MTTPIHVLGLLHACTLPLLFLGCHPFAVKQSTIRSPMYGSPVHIARKRPPGEIVLTPSVRLNEPSTLRLLTKDLSHDERADEPVDWIVPRVQVGFGVDYAVTDKAAVALALSMGRADGRLSWAADGSLI